MGKRSDDALKSAAKFLVLVGDIIDGRIPEFFHERVNELTALLFNLPNSVIRERFGAMIGVAAEQFTYLVAKKDDKRDVMRVFEDDYNGRNELLQKFSADYSHIV